MFSVSDTCKKLKISRATLYRRIELNSVAGSIVNGKRFFNEQEVKELQADEKQTSAHLYDVVSRLSDKIDVISLKIDSLISDIEILKSTEKAAGYSGVSGNKTMSNGANEKRAEEARKKLFSALNQMSEIPMYRGKPSITGIYKETGIDRGTIAKYLPDWIKDNLG